MKRNELKSKNYLQNKIKPLAKYALLTVYVHVTLRSVTTTLICTDM